MSQRIRLFLALLPLTLVAHGCTSDYGKTPGVYPATGKIVDATGKPVTGAYVKFIPMDLHGVQADAELQPDGTFVLKAIGDNEGAVPGKYKVCVDPVSPSPRPAAATSLAKSAVPRAYWNGDTTPLVAEVKAESNQFVFTVK